MNIIVGVGNDRVMLKCDALNYMICTPKMRKGEEVWEADKFYGSLEHALWRIADMKVKAADAKTLEELRDAVIKAREEICEVWRIETKLP